MSKNTIRKTKIMRKINKNYIRKTTDIQSKDFKFGENSIKY